MPDPEHLQVNRPGAIARAPSCADKVAGAGDSEDGLSKTGALDTLKKFDVYNKASAVMGFGGLILRALGRCMMTTCRRDNLVGP